MNLLSHWIFLSHFMVGLSDEKDFKYTRKWRSEIWIQTYLLTLWNLKNRQYSSINWSLISEIILFFLEGWQASPICPGNIYMWLKMSMERWWKDIDREKRVPVQFFHHKFYTDWHGIEPRLLRWEFGAIPRPNRNIKLTYHINFIPRREHITLQNQSVNVVEENTRCFVDVLWVERWVKTVRNLLWLFATAYGEDADGKNFAVHAGCCVSWNVAWLLICSELIVYHH